MKYFLRILAFLFISFSSGFCKDSIHPIKELLYYTNEFTSYSDILSLGVDVKKNNVYNVGTIFTTLSSFKYFFKSPLDGRLFYIGYRDFESKLDHIFYDLTSTSITFYYFKNPAIKFEGLGNWEFVSVTYVDSLEKSCESTLFGYGTFNGFFCVRKGYDVPCLNPDYYFSEKLGKCIPACPEGAYYNSFSDECTSTCDNVSNREERFDCLCKERGFGGYKSSIVSREFVITNTPNGGTSEVLYTGSIYCSTGELNSGDVSDYLKNKGYDDKDLKQSTSDFFEINDVIDKDNSSDSGSSDGTGDGSGGGEQGSTEPMTPEQQQQEQDRNECKAIVAAITADFRAYTQKYVNNGIDCSDSNAVQLARDAKSTIEMKVQTYNQSKCATAYHRINVTVPVHICKTDPTKPDPIEPPTPQNPSDTIKYDENTNTVTITDSAGNTQAVTPTDVTKNDKDELQTIKYTDPETGKTIEYKVKEDGTWERVEYPGQGTGTGTNPSDKEPGTGQGDGKPGGSSDGEGAGTSDDGKKDGNEDGEGNFEGGEFGALGNANDFDKGGELASLYDSLSEKESENNGILDSIISDGFGLVNDIKQSIDNIKETAEDLKNNPFSSSSVTSCAIDLNILETSSQIDLCKYTSQFKALFSSIFFVFLNIVVGFAFFKILILLLINI